MDQLKFALANYFLAFAFVTASLGYGRHLLKFVVSVEESTRLESLTLAFMIGASVWILALFSLGSLGLLTSASVIALCGVGVLLAGFPRLSPATPVHWRDLGLSGQSLFVISLAVLLPLLVKPLAPPLDWDELMYHLPYARLWAEQGSLLIDQWSRFPLLAYNMQLLYAAALTLGQDALPHVLHALCGLAAAGLTFAAGRRLFDRNTAMVAVVIVLFATRREWSTANVDLTVMLFTSGAFFSLYLRHSSGDQRWCYLGLLFFGMAAGTKYQALLYLPALLATLLLVERNPRVLFNSALVLMVCGGYWYFRNFLVSGNPVHPIGSDVFGYWLWNAEDMVRLRYDLGRVKAWPHGALMLFPISILFWGRSNAAQKSLLVLGVASFLGWWWLSGYPRYLMPMYPLLALLSAFALTSVVRKAGLAGTVTRLPDQVQVNGVRLILLLAFMGCTLSTVKAWNQISPAGDGRTALLAERFQGFGLLSSVPDVPDGRLYQYGFEGERYYLGRDVVGDWFGPGRYQDVSDRAGDASALSIHLQSLGVQKLLINTAREPFVNTRWDEQFGDYFTLMAVSDEAQLYWINDQ